jgi:hypothetical protein
VLEKCDIALLRAVESGKRESKEANKFLEKAVEAFKQYMVTYYSRSLYIIDEIKAIH